MTETTSHQSQPQLRSHLMLPLYLLVSLTFWAPPAFPDSGAASVFTQALESFQQKDLAKSRETFLQLIQDSPDDPVLLYNLGLIELTDQHPGRALAYWRKALYLRPGFSPALAGLARIEGQKSTGIPSPPWWHRLLRRLSLSTLLGVTLLLLIASCGLWIRRFQRSKLELPLGSRLMPTTLSGLTLVCLAGGLLHYSTTQTIPLAIVMATTAPIHSSPSNESPALFEFKEGDEVRVRRAEGPWVQVQRGATAIGWVQKDHIFIHTGRIAF